MGPKNRVRYTEVSAISMFYSKDLTVVPSALAKSIPYIEVFTIKGVHHIEVPRY